MSDLTKLQANIFTLLTNEYDLNVNEILILKDIEYLYEKCQGSDFSRVWLDLTKVTLLLAQTKNVKKLFKLEDLLRTTAQLKKDSKDILQACVLASELKEFIDQKPFENNLNFLKSKFKELKRGFELKFVELNSRLSFMVETLEKNSITCVKECLNETIEFLVPRDITVYGGGVKFYVPNKNINETLQEYRSFSKRVYVYWSEFIVENVLKPLFELRGSFYYEHDASNKLNINLHLPANTKMFSLKRVKGENTSNHVKFKSTLDAIFKFSQFFAESLLLNNTAHITAFGKEFCPVFTDSILSQFLLLNQDLMSCLTSISPNESLLEIYMSFLKDWLKKINASCWISEDFINEELMKKSFDLYFGLKRNDLLKVVEELMKNDGKDLVKFDVKSENVENGSGKGKGGKGKGGSVIVHEEIIGPCRVLSSTAVLMDLVYEQVLLGLDFVEKNPKITLQYFQLAKELAQIWVASLFTDNLVGVFYSETMWKCCVYTDVHHGVYKLSNIDSFINTKLLMSNCMDKTIFKPSYFLDLYPLVIRHGETALVTVIDDIVATVNDVLNECENAAFSDKILHLLNTIHETFEYVLPRDDFTRCSNAVLNNTLDRIVNKYNEYAYNKEEHFSGKKELLLKLKFLLKRIYEKYNRNIDGNKDKAVEKMLSSILNAA